MSLPQTVSAIDRRTPMLSVETGTDVGSSGSAKRQASWLGIYADSGA